MVQLRLASLIALLEQHNYLRKSIRGIRIDMPDIFEKVKSGYLKYELYDMLDLMVQRENEFESKYMCWCINGSLPIIIEKKQCYNHSEMYILTIKTNITQLEFDEIIAATIN